MKYTKNVLKVIDDKEIISYNVSGKNGFEFEILNLGGVITKIMTPDKDGNLENIVLGYKDVENYIKNPMYFTMSLQMLHGYVYALQERNPKLSSILA